jgi:phage-related baseplate assembly protein
MTVAINLAELPAPEVLQALDFETTLTNYKNKLIELHPPCAETLALESEPLTKLMQVAAWREMLLIARYNDEAKSLLLAYATDASLDHIAYTYYRGETRLVIVEENLDAFPPIEKVLESDDDFRERVALKLESYSSAGPTEAYRYFARSASGQVKDSMATSPVPGTTLVTVLSREGTGVPSAPVISAVEAALNTITVRPLSEEVIAEPAEIITYALVVGLRVYNGPDQTIIKTTAENALADYTSKSHKLGINHTIAGFHKAAKQEGVWDVDLNLTESIVVTKRQAAYCTSILVEIIEVTS